MHYALFSDFPSHIHVVCKYSIQAVCKLNIFLQNFRCDFLNSCEHFEKPVYTVCTSLRITTLVYLIEVPALMQNLDSEEREMKSFSLAVQT